MRDQRRRRHVFISLHRKGEGRIGIIRGFGFMHADIRMHSCPAAVTVRLAWDLHPVYPEIGRRSDIRHVAKERQRISHRFAYIVNRIPTRCIRIPCGLQHIYNPAPAVPYFTCRRQHPIETLGAAFVVDKGTVAFSKGRRGKQESGL